MEIRSQLLSEMGYLVVRCDNRGSSRRGLAFEGHIRHRMGTIELEDQKACLRLLSQIGLCDLHHVGITGWSYGGYLTAMALLKHKDVFRVGISGAPVTDWDGYDTAYTERYMGTPLTNADGYAQGSVLNYVDKLEGNLLLVHGLIDENVHFRHTARLIDELIKHGKKFDLLILPEERHGPRKPAARIYLEERILGYFLEHL
jgi:dipeptidyl-peptidase-4